MTASAPSGPPASGPPPSGLHPTGPSPSGPAGAGAPLPPLLLVCALGIERRALRAGLPPGAPARVLRTGMGPRAARRTALRAFEGLRGAEGAGACAVLVSGFCAGLAPGMLPGDVVVAAEVRETGESTVACSGAEPLSRALRDRGFTVHTGPLVCSDHVVRGRERAALHAGGALAVDMESGPVLRTALETAPGEDGPSGAGRRPVAVVRVVVDTPEHELLRPGTLRTGLTAYRALRALVPALLDWHGTVLPGHPPPPGPHSLPGHRSDATSPSAAAAPAAQGPTPRPYRTDPPHRDTRSPRR